VASIHEHERYLETRLQAQRRATLVQVAALAGAMLCIALAARLQTPINKQRQELQLVTHSDIYKDLPPKYAWVSAAGGTFRGIAADILWARAEQLKQEGKYYESHQLAKWICTLQPRFAAVWTFQAWNMSYNIAYAARTARERWQWVYNGIRLLRDEGIPNNPRVIPLYHQMAWTWSHKVGERADDFHMAYKRIWAATMETLLGAPPAGVSNAEAIDWFRPVAEATRDLEALIQAHPGVQKLIDDLDNLGIDVEVGTTIDRIFHPLEETFFKSYTAYTFDTGLGALRSGSGVKTEQPEQQDKLWECFKTAPKEDLDALLAFLRAKVLREQYKMDPQYMLDLTAELGSKEPIPIDWRTPWSQAIYWAKYGVEKGTELKNVKEFDRINTDRVLINSLVNILKQGQYSFRINLDEPAQSFLWFAPDTRYVEAMHNKYLELGKAHADEGEDIGETAGAFYSGHVNNLHLAIVSLYLEGRREEAQKYLDYLAVNYKEFDTRQTKVMYLQGLDDFVMGYLKESITNVPDVVYMISSVLTRGYVSLASGWLNEYTSAVETAGLLYKTYQKSHQGDIRGRLTLPLFADMRALTLQQFVLGPYPLVYRSIVWNRAQVDIQRRCYDFMAPYLAQHCETLGLDVTKAFPEPAGMAEWRKTHPTPANPEEVVEQYKKKKKEAEKK